MVSSTALMVVLFAQLFALGAARDLWLPSLPRCWQSCFANTGDGCSSSSCESHAPPPQHTAHRCTDSSQASARRRRTAARTSAAPCLAPCRDAMPTTGRWIWPWGPSSCCAPPSVHAYPKVSSTTRTQRPPTPMTKTRSPQPQPQHAHQTRRRQTPPRRGRPPPRRPRR
jgi:hypothetical protein